jgi:hypothetical protein
MERQGSGGLAFTTLVETEEGRLSGWLGAGKVGRLAGRQAGQEGHAGARGGARAGWAGGDVDAPQCVSIIDRAL